MSDPQGSDQAHKGDRPGKKQRMHLNCKECRRTKTKCDRSWPCSGCVDKGLADSCPNGVLNTNRAKKETIAILEARIRALEGQLRRYGFQPEGQHDEASAGNGLVVEDVKLEAEGLSAVEMAGKLSELLIHPSAPSRSGRWAPGAEATAFYWPSPESSSDEDTPESYRTADANSDGKGVRSQRDKSTRQDVWKDGLEWIPWGRSSKASVGKKGQMPAGRLLDRCRSMLPGRAQAEALFETYWEETSWRVKPVSRTFLLSHIFPAVYDSQDGVHPHDLALLFSMVALALLFDPSNAATKSPELNERATAYHELAYACLTGGNFYADITPSSIATMFMISIFLINANEGTTPDGLNAFITLGLRLATQAGYHREASIAAAVKDMPDPQLQADVRRRIFYEMVHLERVHCMAWLLPLSLQTHNFDTLTPSDESPNEYRWCMWSHNRLTARMVEYWTASPTPPYSVLVGIDNDIRTFVSGLDEKLQCGLVSTGFAEGIPSTYLVEDQKPRFQLNGTRERYAIAEQYLCLMLNLHRPLFVQSMITGAAYRQSVEIVVDAVRRTVNLVDEVVSLDIAPRWFSFPAVLFAVLHCQTALIIKTNEPSLFPARLRLLERGVEILDRAAARHPNDRIRGMAHGAKRLLRAANEAVHRASVSPVVRASVLQPTQSSEDAIPPPSSGPFTWTPRRCTEPPADRERVSPAGFGPTPDSTDYANLAPVRDIVLGFDPTTETSRAALDPGDTSWLAGQAPTFADPPRVTQAYAAQAGGIAANVQGSRNWWDDYALYATGRDSRSLQMRHPSPSQVQDRRDASSSERPDALFQFGAASRISSLPHSALQFSDADPPASHIGQLDRPEGEGIPQMADFGAWLESLTEELISQPAV